MTEVVSQAPRVVAALTRSRLRNFRAVLGAIGLLTGAVGCGAADVDHDGEVDESLGVVSNAAVVASAPSNSPAALDQKFLPGMGYLDGTTCDIWPRALNFRANNARMGLTEDVLARYRTPSTVATLRSLNSHMAEIGVDMATAVGSKYELVVTEASLPSSEKALVAVDDSTGKGFMINDGWLCTERALSVDPLSCKEHSVSVNGTTYSVLGRAQKSDPPSPSMLSSSGPAVVLVAPHIRFAPSVANGEIVADTLLVAVGQRIYGGSKYVTGENLAKRTSNYAKLTVRRRLPDLSASPTYLEWRRALADQRRPGLVALIGDEVGGIKQLTAESPALVESVLVGYHFDEPAHYEPSTRTLYVRTGTYFSPTTSACNPRLVPGFNGRVSCEYHLDLVTNLRPRDAGKGGGTVLVSGSTARTTTLSTGSEPSFLGAGYSLTNLRNYLKSILRPLLEPANGGNIYQVIVTRGSTNVATVNGDAWNDTSGYAASTLDTMQARLAGMIQDEFAPNDAELEPMTAFDAGTETALRQAVLGGQLFTRGAFADVLFGRSELESLRTGVVSASWADTWKLMSDENLGAARITSFDALTDFNLNAAKRARAYELAAYREIEPRLRAKSNVLGLPYGQVASNWFTSPSDGQPSIYAAQERWNELGSLVGAFQTAAAASHKLKDRAERDALLGAVNNLSGGLKRTVAASAAAAKTVSAAAKVNSSTQAASLAEFEKGYQRLSDLSKQLQGKMNTHWGCPAGADAATCIAAADQKLDQLESACKPDAGGFAWAQPLVELISEFIPVVKVVDEGLEKMTGKNLTGTIDAILIASAGDIKVDQELVRLLAEAAYEFIALEKEVQDIAALSKAIRKIIDESSPTCKAGGIAKTNLDQFRGEMILLDSLMQNYAIQLGLVKAQIDAQLGHLGYLSTQGDAYDALAASQNTILADLNSETKPLLDKLNALSSGGAYSEVAAQQRAFMSAACGTALRAARTSQADLHLVSQALQTSTGTAITRPHLVLPANPAYHFASGAAAEMSQADSSYGFGTSLWDAGAFSARFTPSGSSATTSYLSRAGKRFAQLVNGEVCDDNAPKPATRFVVRKFFNGQALKTLAKNGQLDFKVTLDDLVASAKDGSNPVKGVVAQNLSTQAFDMKLDGAFVMSSLYSVCNGPAGNECSKRVLGNNLSGVASGAFNTVNLVSRGTGYVPDALVKGKAGADGISTFTCARDQERVDATFNLLLAGTPTSVSTCLTPVLTPRAYAGAEYWESAGLPDSQILTARTEICANDARTLAGRKLQGIPVLGSWALANSSVLATALSSGMASAPIADGTLPAPSGATAVEVLFLVGTEPVKPSDNGGYTLKP